MIRRYAEANAEHWQANLADHTMGCVTEPEEVAAAALYLRKDAT